MDVFLLHPERIGLIAAAFLAGEVLAARGWRSSRAPAEHGLLLAAGAWGLWALWEWLIASRSPEANIRIDLLLVVPFVALVSLIGIALEVRRALRTR